ncbi:hypothetical protein [Acidovorax sp. NB1]|uniref:hypothetical protein n=1 Tax=Acidovorax sp. NB1 TaxID=1943571 RepID=UPI0010F36680|nr:hypothetical protein [Acidovorax sp. NB1]GDY37255.1 hypothetical protein ACINB_31470 [Acidovorax sp. NB1]
MALFGESKVISLARALLIERVRSDPTARAGGFTTDMAKKLDANQIAGTVEATVATIMETFAGLTLKGASPEDALRRIEAHRRSIGSSNDFYPDAGTADYIRYRFEVEYQGAQLPPGHLDFCIHAANHFFTYVDGKGDLNHAILFAQHERDRDRLEYLLDHLVVAFRDDDIESYEYLQQQAQAWAEFRSEQSQKRAAMQLRAELRRM